MEEIAIWFSCGAVSAVAAKLTLDRYRETHRVRLLNTPIDEEGDDNPRFLRDCVRWLQHPIESVVNPKWGTSARGVWEKERFMSGPRGASCTRALKKEARQNWERENSPAWHVFGFASDERERHERFVLTERANVLPVLIDARMTKAACVAMVADAGLRLPSGYRDGFPNANCRGCIKVTAPAYWNHTRKVYPDVFADRAAQSRAIGCKLVEVGKRRIYLDELDPNETRGRPLKSFDVDCGLFCEEGSQHA